MIRPAHRWDASVAIYEPVVILYPERVSIGEGSRIDSFVKLEGGEGLDIGRGVHIASFAHIGAGGGRVHIGDYAAVASGGKVISGMCLTEFPSLSPMAPDGLWKAMRTVTTIGPYACIFTNAVVLPGIRLGEGAVLGAGSVASHDIPDWEVWFGNPARCVTKREKARALLQHRLAEVG